MPGGVRWHPGTTQGKGSGGMDEGGGGWLWLIVDVAMVAALAGAIFYGYRQWRAKRRTPGTRAREEEGIRKVYDEDKE